eukprot:1393690-Prymnesium_polylepis.1
MPPPSSASTMYAPCASASVRRPATRTASRSSWSVAIVLTLSTVSSVDQSICIEAALPGQLRKSALTRSKRTFGSTLASCWASMACRSLDIVAWARLMPVPSSGTA